MNKYNLKKNFYDLLKPLETSINLKVRDAGSDIAISDPLLTYSILSKNALLVQNHIERWSDIYFLVRIYAKSSVLCTQISDSVDLILKPAGFIETNVVDVYDSKINKHTITSVYSRKMDEDGTSYNMK